MKLSSQEFQKSFYRFFRVEKKRRCVVFKTDLSQTSFHTHIFLEKKNCLKIYPLKINKQLNAGLVIFP